MTTVQFGYNRGIPEDVKTVWGARLIAPCDLVHDRQDLVAENDEAKSALIAWLNGSPSGSGAIAKMRDWLRANSWQIRGDRDQEHVLYEDDDGIIVVNTNASYGYVYVAGWLKTGLSDSDREQLRDIRRGTEIGRMHDELAEGGAK